MINGVGYLLPFFFILLLRYIKPISYIQKHSIIVRDKISKQTHFFYLGLHDYIISVGNDIKELILCEIANFLLFEINAIISVWKLRIIQRGKY